MKKTTLLLLVLLITAFTTLAACGNTGTSESSESASDVSEVEAETESQIPQTETAAAGDAEAVSEDSSTEEETEQQDHTEQQTEETSAEPADNAAAQPPECTLVIDDNESNCLTLQPSNYEWVDDTSGNAVDACGLSPTETDLTGATVSSGEQVTFSFPDNSSPDSMTVEIWLTSSLADNPGAECDSSMPVTDQTVYLWSSGAIYCVTALWNNGSSAQYVFQTDFSE